MRKAKLMAADNSYVFEQELVKTIIRMNAALNKFHLLTAEMHLAGVEPSSNGIFAWGVQKLGGVDHRRLSAETVHLALLDHFPKQATYKGVSHLDCHYNSNALQTHRLSLSGRVMVDVMFNDALPEEMYWIDRSGKLNTLKRTKADNQRFDRFPTSTIKLLHEYEGVRIVLRRSQRRGEILSRAQEDLLRRRWGQKPRKQRNAPSAASAMHRRMENKLQQQVRPQPKLGGIGNLAEQEFLAVPSGAVPDHQWPLNAGDVPPEKNSVLPSSDMSTQEARTPTASPAPTPGRKQAADFFRDWLASDDGKDI